MKTIGKDGILLRLAKDMYPEKDDLSSIEVKHYLMIFVISIYKEKEFMIFFHG